MTEPEPFCWSFPQGRGILCPAIVATIAFALSIVVNMSCEFVTVEVSPATGGGSSSPSGGSSSYDYTNGGCRVLSTWTPQNVPDDFKRLFSPASDQNDSKSRFLQSSSDPKFNGGLWLYSSEKENNNCMPYTGSMFGATGVPEIDAAFKAARAGGILASIASFALVVVFWLNSCLPHSMKTQIMSFVMLILAFIFEGMTAFVFISDSCNEITEEVGETNITIAKMKCLPSWGLYCAAVSCVFFLAAAIGVVAVPRGRNQGGAAKRNVSGPVTAPLPLHQTQVGYQGQAQQAAHPGSVIRRTNPDGSSELISRNLTPEGNVIVTKETTYPDGMKKVERSIEPPNGSTTPTNNMQSFQQQPPPSPSPQEDQNFFQSEDSYDQGYPQPQDEYNNEAYDSDAENQYEHDAGSA